MRGMSEALVESQPDVSVDSNVVQFPVRHGYVGQGSLHQVVLAVATAEDFGSALACLLEWLSQDAGVSRVEWWGFGDDGAPELLGAAGSVHPRRHNLPQGPAGVLVLHGGRLDPNVEFALSYLSPILRRRAAEERLTSATMQLARRNEALEDFAALVAHELKAPLQAALVADDPSGAVEDALQLVDSVLQASKDAAREAGLTSTAESLEQAADDLRADVAITADLATPLPLPPEPLRVILRNLLSNAVAAGAEHVHVTAEHSSSSFRLLVDDDGAGLSDVARYASGSGLGLTLSRRIAGRFGGRIELAPHPSGGTRAKLEFLEATQ